MKRRFLILSLLSLTLIACEQDPQWDYKKIVINETIKAKQTSALISIDFDAEVCYAISRVELTYWQAGAQQRTTKRMAVTKNHAQIELIGLEHETTYMIEYALFNLQSVQLALKNSTSSFITINPALPKIYVPKATVISPTSAVLSGNAQQGDSYDITDRGFIYGLALDSEIGRDQISCGKGNGTFSTEVQALRAGATYYYCAYATNRNGTAYSDTLTFQTPSK